MEIKTPSETVISAKVFRAKKNKPFLLPKVIWKWALKKRLPGTGKWIDMGVLVREKQNGINTNKCGNKGDNSKT